MKKHYIQGVGLKKKFTNSIFFFSFYSSVPTIRNLVEESKHSIPQDCKTGFNLVVGI